MKPYASSSTKAAYVQDATKAISSGTLDRSSAGFASSRFSRSDGRDACYDSSKRACTRAINARQTE